MNEKKVGLYDISHLSELIARVSYHLAKGNISSYDDDGLDAFIKKAIEEIGIKYLFNHELFDNHK